MDALHVAQIFFRVAVEVLELARGAVRGAPPEPAAVVLVERAEEDGDALCLQRKGIGGDLVEVGVVDLTQVAAGHDALHDVAVRHEGGEAGEVVFTVYFALFRDIGEVRHVGGERDDGAFPCGILAQGDSAVDGGLSRDGRQRAGRGLVVLVLGVIPGERHRVDGDERRVVPDHAVGVGALGARVHEQVVHVAVKHVVGVRDALEERIEARSLGDGLRVRERGLLREGERLEVELLLLCRLHRARDVAVVIGERDVIDAERAAVVRLGADEVDLEEGDRHLRRVEGHEDMRLLVAVLACCGVLEVDVRDGLDFLAVLCLHVDLCLEGACRHGLRLIVEIKGDAVGLPQIERLFRGDGGLAELHLAPVLVLRRAEIDLGGERAAADLLRVLDDRLALVGPFAVVLPAAGILLERPGGDRLRRLARGGERRHGRGAEREGDGKRQRQDAPQHLVLHEHRTFRYRENKDKTYLYKYPTRWNKESQY